MSLLTLRLPETLHQQLNQLAEHEGVSLNQYIVYALTRQVTSAYTIETISGNEAIKQKQSFENLMQDLGQVSSEEIEEILAQRETIEPEKNLNTDMINRFQQRIRERTNS